MKRLKLLIVVILIFAVSPAASLDSGEVTDTLDRLSDRLMMISVYDHNGWGRVPTDWTIQQRINAIASDSQLVEMATSHSRPVVRAAAFLLLLHRGNPQVAAILENSLADRSKISVMYGDMISGSTVGGFEVETVESMWRKNSSLVFVDSLKMDSMIFHTPGMTHIRRLDSIIESLPQSESNYSRIHRLVYDEGYSSGLKALAAYRRDSDKKIIKKALLEYSKGLDKEHVKRGKEGRTTEALKAVCAWPDPDFREEIEKVARYEIRRMHINYQRLRWLYEALLAYGDQWAHDLIEQLLNDHSTIANHYHQIYFLTAYDKNPVAGFDDLLPLCDSSRDEYENFYKRFGH